MGGWVHVSENWYKVFAPSPNLKSFRTPFLNGEFKILVGMVVFSFYCSKLFDNLRSCRKFV